MSPFHLTFFLYFVNLSASRKTFKVRAIVDVGVPARMRFMPVIIYISEYEHDNDDRELDTFELCVRNFPYSTIIVSTHIHTNKHTHTVIVVWIH